MKKITALILSAIMGLSLISAPTFAATKGQECTCSDGRTGHVTVSTSILSACDCGDEGKGGAIMNILNLVVDILSIGIGILGVIGISIVGVQYLTAGGNEEKTRKAKRRLFEIILGLAAYAVIFALLKFLLPGFSTSTTQQNQSTQQDQSVQKPSQQNQSQPNQYQQNQ